MPSSGSTAANAVRLAALSALLAAAVLQLRRLRRLKADLRRAEEEARFAAEERRAERAGRVKAERELRQLQLRLGQLTGGPAGASPRTEGGQPAADGSGSPDWQSTAFPMRPIGLLRSCFTRRNGTPRQPLLVPAARAKLTLRTELSADFFEGLQGYTHCWVLYVFHENTDLQRLWQPGRDSGVRAKIRQAWVPRLDGGKLGVFATRSPHRPCPIGLSVARVVCVEGRTLMLAGADIVDGSPVLDIKPFVPFCDNVPAAQAPSWVAAQADDEPLLIGQLVVPPAAEEALRRCWVRLGTRSLYRSFEEYRQLVAEVLSRDIRSVTQRIKVPQRAQHGGPAALSSTAGAGLGTADQQQASEQGEGFWKVVLDGIQISYDVEEGSSNVVLRSAELV
ncbi:hypothetical protein ABPG77_007413 [Micractinium sp. CCAP 211/92]